MLSSPHTSIDGYIGKHPLVCRLLILQGMFVTRPPKSCKISLSAMFFHLPVTVLGLVSALSVTNVTEYTLKFVETGRRHNGSFKCK